jgi:Domain of unknown function (DUF1992)
MTTRPTDADHWERIRRRETLVERQIREAMEDGRFDDLPHQGERLPLVDDRAAGEWSPAFRMMRNAGVAPAWIEADKEVRALRARRDAVFARAPRAASDLARRRDRAELEAIVREHDVAVARLNALAPTVAQHRRSLTLDEDLAQLERIHRHDIHVHHR